MTEDKPTDEDKPRAVPAFVISLESAIEVLSGILEALKELQKSADHASLTPLHNAPPPLEKEDPPRQPYIE